MNLFVTSDTRFAIFETLLVFFDRRHRLRIHQKILDHRGIVWNCWTEALAHPGVAGANELQAKNSSGTDADPARVRAPTKISSPDPDIPILKEAKAEQLAGCVCCASFGGF